MTKIIARGILEAPTAPIDSHLLQCRKALLENKKFQKIFQDIEQPAAVLTLQHQVVLANRLLAQLAGKISEGDLVGWTPGDLGPWPDQPDLQASIRYCEVQGRSYFVLTFNGQRAGD